MKAVIKTPCKADWNAMKIGLKSRFCESCSKNVMDFTKMSREQILSYLLENRNKQTCGRIYSGQLDFSTEDYLVTINSLAKKHKNSNLGFYLLTMGALILSGNLSAQSNKQTKTEIIYQQPPGNPAELEKLVKKDSTETYNPLLQEITLGVIEQGDIELQYIPEPDTISPDIIYSYVEKMPEFPGGIDSLHQFIKDNLSYPKSKKGSGINGVIYVQFVVESTGVIKDPKILRSIYDGTAFDKAVINMIKKMPDWIPGEQLGKKVPVYFNLPIRFKDD